MTTLKVNDKIIKTNNFDKERIEFVIDRITKKMAFCGTTKFDKSVSENGDVRCLNKRDFIPYFYKLER